MYAHARVPDLPFPAIFPIGVSLGTQEEIETSTFTVKHCYSGIRAGQPCMYFSRDQREIYEWRDAMEYDECGTCTKSSETDW